jgi:hypothetical protein
MLQKHQRVCQITFAISMFFTGNIFTTNALYALKLSDKIKLTLKCSAQL